MSKFLTVRPMINNEKNYLKDLQEYWSRVGMLLFLIKHSSPGIANVNRKLSKANDGESPAAFQKLLQ